MHEFAVCRSLINEVSRVAAEYGTSAVTGIAIAIGPLSGVEAGLLARAFEVVRVGTVAEGASLEIEATPVVVHCPACDRETSVRSNALLCGDCGSWKVALKSGDELLLMRVELASQEDPIAATA
jgi:hydrogenase nickel incorporation protein HypA/HybF